MSNISIVIPTFNRAEYLRVTLDSVASVVARYGKPVEILVVNNRCTDATDEIVIAFQHVHPALDIQLLYEKRQGLSHARNTGIEHSHGDIICFLDDDVFIPEQWLVELLKDFTLDNNIGCVAGRIKLCWPEKIKPDWIDEKYYGFYGQFEYGDTSYILTPGEIFYGGNFAITRQVVETIGGFNTSLGRKGASLLSGEDTDYTRRLFQAGYAIAYSAAGFIYHRVTSDRLTVCWLWRRYLWQGVSTYFAPEHNFPTYPICNLPKLLSNLFLLPLVCLSFNKRLVLRTCFRIANALGPFYGWYLQLARCYNKSHLPRAQTNTDEHGRARTNTDEGAA